jgi:hypothetical protein
MAGEAHGAIRIALGAGIGHCAGDSSTVVAVGVSQRLESGVQNRGRGTAEAGRMRREDVGAGVRVKLTEAGKAARLWGENSPYHGTIVASTKRPALYVDAKGVEYASVNVDYERQARIRTMRLDLIEVAHDER